MSKITRLAQLRSGTRARIISFDHNPEVRSRLNSMGLSEGVVVEVLADSGNYLVSAGRTRIGIEPILAQTITVQIL